MTKLECLAVLYGFKKFREHLYGEKISVVTDHKALIWLMSLSVPKHRLAQWILEFQAYNFELQYAEVNGPFLAVPDALSRDTMRINSTVCARCIEYLAVIGERGGLQ